MSFVMGLYSLLSSAVHFVLMHMLVVMYGNLPLSVYVLYTQMNVATWVQLVRRVAQEPSVWGSNPSGARVQWNEGCAKSLVGGSNPYEME